jgi:hypothetical protein
MKSTIFWESRALLVTFFYAGFLLSLYFDPEDGGDMFLRNVGCLSTDYTALYPRRWCSSYNEVHASAWLIIRTRTRSSEILSGQKRTLANETETEPNFPSYALLWCASCVRFCCFQQFLLVLLQHNGVSSGYSMIWYVSDANIFIFRQELL